MNPFFQSGLQALNRCEYGEAAQCFQQARTQARDDARLTAYFAWAQYMDAVKRSGRAVGLEAARLLDGRADLRREISDAVSKVPKFDEGYVFLGRMSLDEEDRSEAILMFKKALRINRRNESAATFLQRAKRDLPRPSLGSRLTTWMSTLRSSHPGSDDPS